MHTFKQFITESIDKIKVDRVISNPSSYHHHRYKAKDGSIFYGIPLSDIPSAMRDLGYKSGKHFKDSDSLKQAGYKVRQGEYAQGARPTGKSVDVLHAYDHGSEEHSKSLKSIYNHNKQKLSSANDTFSKSMYEQGMKSANKHHKSIFGKDID